MKHILLTLTLLIGLAFAKAQTSSCLMIEAKLEHQIQQSSLAVTATVTNKQGVYNAAGNFIYTKNTLRIDHVHKGTYEQENLTLVSRGGIVGDKGIIENPGIDLYIGQKITAFLVSDQTDLGVHTTSNNFTPFYGPQGFYTHHRGKVVNAFQSYETEQAFFNRIALFTGRAPIQGKASIITNPQTEAISGFNPSSLAAGDDMVLTIMSDNNDFGATRGNSRIRFPNANNGGATTDIEPVAGDYVSWSANMIQVDVPVTAGTGIFEVDIIDTFGNVTNTLNSGSALTVMLAGLKCKCNLKVVVHNKK